MKKTRDADGHRHVEHNGLRATPMGGGYWAVEVQDNESETGWRTVEAWTTKPIAAEALRLGMTPEEMRVREAFEQFGFVEEGTGGNCRAWVLKMGGGREFLITNGDLGLVTTFREKCQAAWVDGRGHLDKMADFETVHKFLMWLVGMTTGEKTTVQALEECYE